MLSTSHTTHPRGEIGGTRPPARAASRDLIEPDPLPCLAGLPPKAMLRRDGRPPDGFTFLGARRTVDGWLLPCPICCQGWVPLAPDRHEPDGYRLAVEIGCSRGCHDPAEMMRTHLLRLGELPPLPPPDARARAYATACARRILRELPTRPSLPRLRSAAHALGGWIEAGDLDEQAALVALLNASRRSGLETAEHAIAAALATGRLQPGRLPQ